MVVILIIGLALAGWGVFKLTGQRNGIRGRSGPAVAYGYILAGAILVVVSGLVMAGVIRE
jgi:hypothetical protein